MLEFHYVRISITLKLCCVVISNTLEFHCIEISVTLKFPLHWNFCYTRISITFECLLNNNFHCIGILLNWNLCYVTADL